MAEPSGPAELCFDGEERSGHRAAQMEGTRGAHLRDTWAEEVPGSPEQLILEQIHIRTLPLLHWYFCPSLCALSHTQMCKHKKNLGDPASTKAGCGTAKGHSNPARGEGNLGESSETRYSFVVHSAINQKRSQNKLPVALFPSLLWESSSLGKGKPRSLLMANVLNVICSHRSCPDCRAPFVTPAAASEVHEQQ